MPIESGLFAYAALASIALSRKKYRPAAPLPLMPVPAHARAVGLGLMLLALAVAIWRLGVAQGVVGWTGQLCVAGAVFIILLSWQNRTAFLTAMAAPFAAMAVMLF